MPDEVDVKSLLPRPSEPAFKWRGENIVPRRILQCWQDWRKAMKASYDSIEECQGMRRMTTKVKLPDSWRTQNPEAAAVAVVPLAQRKTLEQEIKARIGKVWPYFVREPLGDLQEDDIAAERCEDFLNEWAMTDQGIPYDVYIGKLTEDGWFCRERLPLDLDLEAEEIDFFDRLDEEAVEALDAEERGDYKVWEGHEEEKRPYYRMGEDGLPKSKATWDRDKNGRPPKTGSASFKRDRDKSEEAHKKAVQRYLLQQEFSQGRIIPALECAPLLIPAAGRKRFRLAAMVTRQLVAPEEALEHNYTWKGMGNRLLVPQGYRKNRMTGQNGCYYLYSLYCTIRDEEGKIHPIIATTVGGEATTWSPGAGSSEPDSKDAVYIRDLYEEYGIQRPLWSWHPGLHTEDDDPQYYARGYLDTLVGLLKGLEGIQTAIRATTMVTAFTGHVEKLDPKLVEADPDAFKIQGPNGRTLRKLKIPKPGEIEVGGDVTPFNQAQVGVDAWRLEQSDKQMLAEMTATDQSASAPGSSGHALVVGETLAKVSKVQITDGSLDAWTADGEDAFVILDAMWRKHKIAWPIQTVEEPSEEEAVSEKSRPKRQILEYDPTWVGDGFFRLKSELPEEENLAAVDLESALADRGYSHFENVMKKKGINDPMKEWLKVLKWKTRNDPRYLDAMMLGLARRRGDKVMVDIITSLQQQQELTTTQMPGAPNGMAAAQLRAKGEASQRQASSGGSAVRAQRAGIQGGEMGTQAAMHDATAQAQVA